MRLMGHTDNKRFFDRGYADELLRRFTLGSHSLVREKEKIMKRLVYALYRRREKILILLVGLFFGMLVGIFLAPVKNGVTIGSYNGNNSEKKKKEEEEDEFNKDLAMEMGELR